MANKKLSIIIVNYQSDQLLPCCVASVYAAIPKEEVEVVIVNNDECDIDSLRKEFSEIVIIDHRKNVGFGSAANLGAAASTGERLLFLNPDSEIDSKNLAEVLEYFEKNIEVAAIGSQVVSNKGQLQEWIAGQETGLWDLFLNNLRIPRSRKSWKSKIPLAVDWVTGTALFVKKDFFQAVSGFDENFFMYFEDMDLCKRLRKKGGKIFYYPAFRVKHLGGKSYADKAKQKQDYYRSQAYYFKKHCSPAEAAVISFIRKVFFS